MKWHDKLINNDAGPEKKTDTHIQYSNYGVVAWSV